MKIVIVKNIIVISIISSIVAGLLAYLSVPFWIGFSGITVIQLVIGYFVSQRDAKIYARSLETAQRKVEELFESNGLDLVCSYCKTKSFVPIILGQENSFKCPNCSFENAVYINVETAQKTYFNNDDKLLTEPDDEQAPIRSQS
jgi:hypothetical protein